MNVLSFETKRMRTNDEDEILVRFQFQQFRSDKSRTEWFPSRNQDTPSRPTSFPRQGLTGVVLKLKKLHLNLPYFKWPWNGRTTLFHSELTSTPLSRSETDIGRSLYHIEGGFSGPFPCSHSVPSLRCLWTIGTTQCHLKEFIYKKFTNDIRESCLNSLKFIKKFL